MQSQIKIKRLLIFRRKNEQRLFVFIFAIIGFVAPVIYGYVNGFPVPAVHDEFSYLLAGDTYAHGRLTNPTPEFSEHFEAPHILVKPTYMSKYPPMQGLFLALGQVLFGHPAFGIWISCGLFAASLFWMLSIWSRPSWAIPGTILMILIIGIDSYWAQSYWGGMVAAAGGALFFGGFRRITKKRFLPGSTVIMTLGGIILINSRPLEGVLTMLPALLVLLYRLILKSDISLAEKFSRIILPGIFIACLALSAMAFYNYRVTGNALRFPYTEHQAQYFSAPLFLFQSPNESNLQGTPRLQRLYHYLNKSPFMNEIESYGVPDDKYLYPLYSFVSQTLSLPLFLLMPPLMILFFLAAFMMFKKSRWTSLAVITFVFTFCCTSFATYSDNVHYSASLTCCIYLILVQGFRLLFLTGRKSADKKTILFLLLFLISFSLFYKQFLLTGVAEPVQVKAKHLSNWTFNLSEPTTFEIKSHTIFFKAILEEKVKNDDADYIVLVDCDAFHNIYDDITYNRADLANSKVIWAIDLGEEKNRELLNFYRNRKPVFVKIKGNTATVSPYPIQNSH